MDRVKDFNIELLSLAADAALFAIFYKLYKDSSRSATAAQNAKTVVINDALKDELLAVDGNRIEYACVEGFVDPVKDVLRSQYKSKYKGVWRLSTLTEHKSKRREGIWSDVKNVIKHVLEQVPFVLSQPETDAKIQVEEADSAELIYDGLSVTFDRFTPSKSGLLQKGLDRMFGEVSNGLHEMEQMLCLGTKLLGIGELVLEDNIIKLVPPTTDSSFKYILTTLSKKEVIKSLMSKAFWYRVCTGVLGIVGLGIIVYTAVKVWRIEQSRKQQQTVIDNIREAHRIESEDAENTSDNICVICLINPRNIVLLNCGHVCICTECEAVLPTPKLCPMCRRSISRHVPIYVS